MMDWFRRWVLNNLALKLIALVSAVLLWSAVSREPMIEVAYSVPVEFHQVPEDLDITTEVVPQAQIRLRGPSRRVRQLSAGEVHPVIDLDNVQPGERTFDLTTAQVHVPYDVEVVQIIPAHIRLTFDKRTSKQVPVKPRVTGSFPTGFGIASITSDPAAITVVGPERRVNGVETALTDPIDATGVVGRASFTTNAYVADPLVRELRPTPIHVTVTTERTSKSQ
jgi:YbbR domain-containing protein